MKTLTCLIFTIAMAVGQTIVGTPLAVEVGHVSAQLMISYEEESWTISAVSYGSNTVTYTLPGHSLTTATAASIGPKAVSTSAACGLTGLSMMQSTTLPVAGVDGDNVTFNDSGVGGSSCGVLPHLQESSLRCDIRIWDYVVLRNVLDDVYIYGTADRRRVFNWPEAGDRVFLSLASPWRCYSGWYVHDALGRPCGDAAACR